MAIGQDVDLLRPLVTGRIIDNYVGQKITVIGYVPKSHPNGTSFDLKACDDQEIKVMLTDPIKDLVFGLVEVIGVSKGNKTILADEIILHENANEFDTGSLNQLTEVLSHVDDFWKCTLES